jgi:dihydrofolate synthase / folylpolyglutamate synthase
VNFAESTAYLYSLGNEVEAMKLGLDNIEALLTALDNPQTNYLKVQIAGTNGKGSVCTFLDSICRAGGISVGLYTSPHLVSITERIKINGEEISEEKFAELATRIRKASERSIAKGELRYTPTFFEQMTAIALVAFAEANVEVAILETGLGGRLDAVTAAGAEIAAITRIDLDHQEYLGDTLQEIAAEKAAIIRTDSRAVVIGDQQPEALAVIEARLEETGRTATGRTCIRVEQTPFAPPSLFSSVDLGLKGAHQLENAHIAVAVAGVIREHFEISDDVLRRGLKSARHPGRLEYIGNVLLDGAHNVGGAKALAEYIRESETRLITVVFGAMRDKDVAEIGEILFHLAQKIVITQPGNSRAASYDDVLQAMPARISRLGVFATDRPTKALDIARAVTPADGLILVTGSLYLVGEVRQILQSQI